MTLKQRANPPSADDAINYTMSPTGHRFHSSDERNRFIFGPVGSGKTVAASMEILFRAINQRPNAQGVRKSRCLVIRKSYPQLKTTVIQTFQQWVGHLGKLKESGSPLEWRAEFPLPDGTRVEMEVWFKSMSKPQDLDDLKSMELTSAYLSECAELPKALLDILKTRLGRYPSKAEGGPSWTGIWGESNPPSMRSHWYETLEEERPEGYEVFYQPPPILHDPEGRLWQASYGDVPNPHHPWVPNPAAENIENLENGYDYYLKAVPGMDWDKINVFILGNYGATKSGKPVYPEFVTHFHRATAPIAPVKGQTVVVGMDFGLDASAVPTQMAGNGAMLVHPSIDAEGMMLEAFIKQKLLPVLRDKFAGCPVLIVGDPSSDRRETVSQFNAFSILQRSGLPAQRALTNDPRMREEAVKWFLKQRDGFFLDPGATLLHEGFTGSYHYQSKHVGAEKTTVYKAEKNEYSHPHDALQYAAMFHYKGSVLDKPRQVARRPVKDYHYA